MNTLAPALAVLSAITVFSSLHAQTIEAPPIVIRSNTVETVQWAQERSGAPAANGVIELQSSTGAGGVSAGVNATGSNLQAGDSTTAQPSTILAAGDPFCPSQAASWTVGGQTCTSSAASPLPRTMSGASASTADSDQPVVGAASFACSMGTWSGTPAAGATCVATNCSAATLSWSGSAVCSANFPTLNHGQSSLLASVNGNTGSASFVCNAGTWQLAANHGCASPAPRNCVWPTDASWRHRYSRVYNQTRNGGTAVVPVPKTSPNMQHQVQTFTVIAHGGGFYLSGKSEQVSYSIGAYFTCNNGTISKSPGLYYTNGESLGAPWHHTAAESGYLTIYYDANSTNCAAISAAVGPFLCAPRSFHSPQ